MSEIIPRQMLKGGNAQPMSFGEAQKTSAIASRYKDIPTADILKSDTRGRWPYRSASGPAMETLINLYHQSSNKVTKLCALRDLFWATDKWLTKDTGAGADFDKSKAAISDLYNVCVSRLCAMLKVPPNVLPNKLQQNLCRMKREHAQAGEEPYYLKGDQLEQFRLTFSNGKLHRWKVSGDTCERAVVDHADADIQAYGGIDMPRECACAGSFVMSAWDELYMTYHFREATALPPALQGGKDLLASFFHSGYMQGERVVCAGEMTVRNGNVTRISNSSGHYRPGPQHLLPVLWLLQKSGVNLGTVEVVLFKPGAGNGSVDCFLKCNGFQFLSNASAISKWDGVAPVGITRWRDNYPNNPTWLTY